MFRVILIDESQRDLLRIVWKDKIDSPVKIFRLTTVTYGTKSAPYLATRSLKQLAIDDSDKYPLAADVIMSDVYMDDLTGADDSESGRKLQVQLISMLKDAGMELHMWSASDSLLLLDSMCQVKDLLFFFNRDHDPWTLVEAISRFLCFQYFSHDLKL
ncbi:uncharacterized protein TNCV_3220791 [Trichonephila clavipes]|nr:uncharacterized protein TNCV_3220791 [Trichonephila clavipes]